MLDEMLYFTDTSFTNLTVDNIIHNKVSLALLMKRSSENLPGDIDEIILQMVYGNSRKYPGDEISPSQRLLTKTDENGDENVLLGIWVPPNRLTKAVALKLLFPNISSAYRFMNTEPTPHYIAVGYDAFKTREVMELSERYPRQVMAFGFFDSDIPTKAKLIAKTLEEFEERTVTTTYEEKIVIQLAKTIPECFTAFSELGPTFMSSDAEAGEIDCAYFFPPGYTATEEEITEVKKKSKKRGKAKANPASNPDETPSVATSDLNKEQSEIDHEETEEHYSDEEKIDVPFEDVDEKLITGADKATSPIET